jgi:hypothetical protein
MDSHNRFEKVIIPYNHNLPSVQVYYPPSFDIIMRFRLEILLEVLVAGTMEQVGSCCDAASIV